ncbi:MAG: rRNA pseudouridine synthase [Treponema sp.]|nr:rRNA pseudouridine synthase [Treponema sp.]
MKKRARGSSLQGKDTTESQDKIRLQLYMARSGVASRRASEAIIAEGRVTVNGVTVTEPGTKVGPGDVVMVDGREIQPEAEKHYVLLNKPAGYVCSLSDEQGRPVAADLLKEAYSERLYNVGRLDMFSCGLIIFTNDGDFAAKLSHPSAEMEKEYIVDSSLPLPRRLAKDFMGGIRIDGVFYRAKEAEELNARRLRVVLVEGKNREIRRVFDHYEVGIKRLIRIRIGNVGIGKLEDGQFRELNSKEVTGLLRLCKSGQY